MTRVFHSESLGTDKEIELDDFASQHLSRVMRVKTGDAITVFNSSGEYAATIQTTTKKTVRVLLREPLNSNTESALKTTLLQAVTRRERMDYAIQKATELGVNIIQPIMTEHCVVKLDVKNAQKKLKHWHGIARHATEQSGRLDIPEIKPVINFNDALAYDNVADDDVVSGALNPLKLIFALNAAKRLHEINMQTPQHVHLALGPVGGFSDSEVEMALKHNFHSIKLGPRIMRAETATTAALTAIQMLWGDLN